MRKHGGRSLGEGGLQGYHSNCARFEGKRVLESGLSLVTYFYQLDPCPKCSTVSLNTTQAGERASEHQPWETFQIWTTISPENGHEQVLSGLSSTRTFSVLRTQGVLLTVFLLWQDKATKATPMKQSTELEACLRLQGFVHIKAGSMVAGAEEEMTYTLIHKQGGGDGRREGFWNLKVHPRTHFLQQRPHLLLFLTLSNSATQRWLSFQIHEPIGGHSYLNSMPGTWNSLLVGCFATELVNFLCLMTENPYKNYKRIVLHLYLKCLPYFICVCMCMCWRVHSGPDDNLQKLLSFLLQ